MKNSTSRSCLKSLLDMQTSIYKNLSKRKTQRTVCLLNDNPVPTNIIKPRKLEEYHKELLEELHAKREIAIDGILEKMPRKTLSIMGPLNKT